MRFNFDKILLVILLLTFLTSLFLIFNWVPQIKASNEAEQIAQKIFYYHVPSAWLGFLAFFVVFLGSVAYLWTRERKYELISVASAEIGILFITLVLITGPIWAKPVWGIWWTWDARLTSSLILWLIYMAYIMLRRYLPDG
ncbi:cytochrome c biogenesis protein CcsA, partial [bacterium]|nr:cytochrome c biogenesis protein CcsA [bacterium]